VTHEALHDGERAFHLVGHQAAEGVAEILEGDVAFECRARQGAGEVVVNLVDREGIAELVPKDGAISLVTGAGSLDLENGHGCGADLVLGELFGLDLDSAHDGRLEVHVGPGEGHGVGRAVGRQSNPGGHGRQGRCIRRDDLEDLAELVGGQGLNLGIRDFREEPPLDGGFVEEAAVDGGIEAGAEHDEMVADGLWGEFGVAEGSGVGIDKGRGELGDAADVAG